MPVRTDHAIRAATEGSPGRLYLEPPAGPAALTREATHWLETALGDRPMPPLVIVIGMGGGDLLPALARRGSDYRLLVIEPDADAARACAARTDWSALRATGRLMHLVGPDYKGADVAWRLFPTAPDAHLLLIHPRLAQTPDAGVAAALVKKILFGVRANAEARRRFAPRYLTNVLRNVPAMARGRDVRALTNAYQGTPALITAAGPSLDRVLDQLPALASQALIIATDTTLRPLLGVGLEPHLAVGADPGQANARHFRELPPRGRTWLVAESALDRTAASAFADRTLWFRLANHHPWPWLRSHGLDVGLVEMWGSVLTAAFEVACLAGCDPIVIVGADLAFTGGRPYCRGTTYEFDWAHNVALGTSLADSWRAQTTRTTQQQTTDIHGQATITTSSLLSFRDWMVARAARSGRRVINATGAGILVGTGVEQHSLGDLSSVWHTDVRSVDEVIGDAPPQVSSAMAAEFERAQSSLLNAATAADPIPQWQEFSGEGFDGTLVGQILADSSSAMRSDVATPPLDALIPWASLERLHGVAGLPEHVERLRQALAGGEWRSDESSRPDALVDALRLLSKLVEGLEPASDVYQVPAVPVPGPLAARYLWPETLRWAVVMFEGLLGSTAMTSMPATPDASYFGGAHARASALESCLLPAGTTAAIRLALEWMVTAAARNGHEEPDAETVVARIAGLETALLSSPRDGASAPCLRFTARAGDAASTFTVPGVEPSSLIRMATGSLRRTTDDGLALLRVRTAALDVVVDLVDSASPLDASLNGDRHTPIVLTDRGMPRSLVAYATRDGAVCVTPYSSETRLVDAAGHSAPHMSWPHPVVGAQPFGDGGAVAWSNGMVDGRAGQAYVMFRHSPADPMTVERIPVRPTLGAWWNNRLYWACYPTPASTWFGVASWAPGEEVRFELPDVALFGLMAADNGLELHPCRFVPSVGFDPALVTAGLLKRSDGPDVPLDLGAMGPCSMRASSSSWHAAAFPQTHTIRLISGSDCVDGGVLLLSCHSPFRLAWIGDSLLVSTLEREVLLFDGLQASLARTARVVSSPGAEATR